MESYPSVEGKFFFYQCSKKLLPKTKLYILASQKNPCFSQILITIEVDT